MSEESKNTEIVRLHLTDIYKADPGKVPSTSDLISEITKVASKNFKNKKISIKLLDSYCPYFRIPKDTKFDSDLKNASLNMEGDYLVFEPTEAVVPAAAAEEPVAARATTPNPEEPVAAAAAAAATDTQQQLLDKQNQIEAKTAETEATANQVMSDYEKATSSLGEEVSKKKQQADDQLARRLRKREKKKRNKKGEIYVVVEGETPDDDDEFEIDLDEDTNDESLTSEFRLDLPNHWKNIKNLVNANSKLRKIAIEANQERIFNEIIEKSIEKFNQEYYDSSTVNSITKKHLNEIKEKILNEIKELKGVYNENEQEMINYFNTHFFSKYRESHPNDI